MHKKLTGFENLLFWFVVIMSFVYVILFSCRFDFVLITKGDKTNVNNVNYQSLLGWSILITLIALLVLYLVSNRNLFMKY